MTVEVNSSLKRGGGHIQNRKFDARDQVIYDLLMKKVQAGCRGELIKFQLFES